MANGDQLDAFAQDITTGLFLPTQARRNVVPWEQLGILNPPEKWSEVSGDLISTLAVLVAQGQTGPTLVKADAAGDLRVGARINAVTKLSAPLAAGATLATVLDTTDFFPGDKVVIVANGAPDTVCANITVKSIFSDTTMEFAATCSSISFNPGDYVVGEAVVHIRTVFDAPAIAGFKVNTAIGAPGTTDSSVMNTTTIKGHRRLATDPERSYDWDNVTDPGLGAQASIATSSFGVGFCSVASMVMASIENVSGAAIVAYMELFNGSAAGGNRRMLIPMWVPNNASKEFTLTGLKYRSADNGFWTWRMAAGVANVAGHLSIAGFVEG